MRRILQGSKNRKKNKAYYRERDRMWPIQPYKRTSLFLCWNTAGPEGRGGMKNENRFQSQLIKEIRMKMPDCFVLKNDGSNVPQGFPDLLILHNDRWGSLECKRDRKAGLQTNQPYYVNRLNEMSFSRFISPENKDEVLHELYQTLGADG